MKPFLTFRSRVIGAGFLTVVAATALTLYYWHKPAGHAHLKLSYTVLIEDELLQDGHWEGLWEPLKTQYPDVDFVVRPRISSAEPTALPPFDLLIGGQSLINEAIEANAVDSWVDEEDLARFSEQQRASGSREGQLFAMPFFETGYQLLYFNRDQISQIPDNWELLNLEAQKYLEPEQEKYYLAAADQPQTYMQMLGSAASSGSLTDIFELIRDLRLAYRSVPLGCQAGCALRLFEEKKSPLLLATDQYLAELAAQFGDKLGLAHLPKIGDLPLHTARRTIFVSKAKQLSPAASELTAVLSKTWRGPDGARLIYKELHRLASGLLIGTEKTGDRNLDQLAWIVQNFTKTMDATQQRGIKEQVKAILQDYMDAQLSTDEAVKRVDAVIHPNNAKAAVNF